MSATDYVTCELRAFARKHKWGPCSNDITFEHILAKQLFRNNKAGLKLAYDVYGDLFGAQTCLNHNAGNKCADTTAAVLYLMRKRLEEHPEVFPLAIEEVAATFRVVPPYLRLEYLRD
jgi:hypothetical protein